MNNFNGELYPSNIGELLRKSYQIAENINEQLTKTSCPKLNELYFASDGRVNRNKPIFIENKIEIEKGLYVFAEEIDDKTNPLYIGISRNISTRLRNHGWGKTHNTATLAYLIADKKYRHQVRIEGQQFGFTISSRIPRKYIDSTADVNTARLQVQNFKVAIYPIQDDYELYFHEVVIAGILKTKWNNFRTH